MQEYNTSDKDETRSANIKPDANFYSLGGVSVHNNQSGEYKEYRKRWIEYPSQFILRDFPMHLDIESTSYCNIRCVFCDKLPYLRKDDMGYMKMQVYKRIIDEGASNNLFAIKLSYRGEPLLHEDIVEMVGYAKKKGILDVYFNTNGMLLDENMSDTLIAAGLDRISISVEGIEPEPFEEKRIGADFNAIVNNIDTLLKLRDKRRVKHPKVRVQTIYFPGFDIGAYKSFWISRCDEIVAVDYKDASIRAAGLMHNWACPQLWQRMTIDWKGTVFPCNNDDLGLLALGNVEEKSIYEYWHNDRVKDVRALHKTGQSHKAAGCDGCPWRAAQIKKLQLSQDA